MVITLVVLLFIVYLIQDCYKAHLVGNSTIKDKCKKTQKSIEAGVGSGGMLG